MPRVSAKRKARTAQMRAMSEKRWKKPKDSVGESEEPGGEGGVGSSGQQQVGAASPEPPTQSAASFRHSLLPQDQRIEEVTVNSGMYTISHQRLSDLLNLVSCGECGTKSTFNIFPSYFDCTLNIKCDNCQSILLCSEPEKCKNSKYSQGNVIHVYHSLCEGYGKA